MITLLMFTYNEQDHIKHALEGIINQDYPDFELIILDDCSTDNTFEILSDYEKKDKRISLYSNNLREGYCYNYRKTFELIKGQPKYFAWIAGHDVYHVNWLSTHIDNIEKNENVALVYSESLRIDKNNKTIFHDPVKYSNNLIQSEYDRISDVVWNGKGYGNMIYGVMRYEIVKNMNKFPYTLMPDMVFILEISKWGCIYCIPEILWDRRFLIKYDHKRQRQIAFNKIPMYIYINWRIVNFFNLIYRTVLNIPSKDKKRKLGLYLSFNFMAKYFIDYLKMYLFKLRY